MLLRDNKDSVFCMYSERRRKNGTAFFFLSFFFSNRAAQNYLQISEPKCLLLILVRNYSNRTLPRGDINRASVYDILHPTTAITGYAIGLGKVSVSVSSKAATVH